MNVHLLQHLPDCVRLWGPLWAYWCFHFENLNGYLKSLFHGTRDMSKQVLLFPYHFISLPWWSILTVLFMQMAFSYIIMQGLPATLPQFSCCTNTVSTFADILYGKRSMLYMYTYLYHTIDRSFLWWFMVLYTCFIFHRVIKQAMTPDVSVLGGVTLQVALPCIMHALQEYLHVYNLALPPGQLVTM